MTCGRRQDRAGGNPILRVAVVLTLAMQLGCAPQITERCWLVAHPTPPPALPAGFAEIDALLLRRATDLTLASRHLDSSLVIVFRKDFAEVLLPSLCERLEQARNLAMAGRTAEAGKKYQALLVSSQVLAFAVAIQSMAQYADRRLQPGGQISLTQEKFADEAAPILEAALGENPRDIERALNAHPGVFAGWAKLLEEWPTRVTDGAHKAKVAMVVVDIAFLVVATYEAAGAAAEIAAAGRPPMPPLPAFATAGGATAGSSVWMDASQLAEALRKLVVSGALDAAVVSALSHSLGGDPATARPLLPTVTPMSAEHGPAPVSSGAQASIAKPRNLRSNPLEGTSYTDKVRAQMRPNPRTGRPDNHGFPLEVDNSAGQGRRIPITGNDGATRLKIELDGSYNGQQGTFEWLIEPDGTVNHRLFVPKPNGAP